MERKLNSYSVRARVVFLLLILPLPTFANNSSDAAVKVAAINSITGDGIAINQVIQSPKTQSLPLVDHRNVRYLLGPGASAFFDESKRFHLLRGSVICESKDWEELDTANATLRSRGKAVVSYDYQEKSTSVFILAGEGKLQHQTYANRVQELQSLEGSILTSGDFYPSWLRSLQFQEVNEWLGRYGWSEARRDNVLSALKERSVANRKLASVGLKEQAKAVNERNPNEDATKELQEYFPGYVDQPRDLYGERFTSSELHGKNHSRLERAMQDKDQIQLLTPEEAAVMILPKMHIKPQIRVFSERAMDGRNPAGLKRVSQFQDEEEKVKIVKVYVPAKEPYANVADPAVRRTLSRLDEVAQARSNDRSQELKQRYFDQLRENF